MNQEIFEQTIDSLQEKLGEEMVAKVADDIGMLKTAQTQALNEQKEMADKLTKAEQDRKDMQAANSRLLQQIPMGKPAELDPPEEPSQSEPFDFRSMFDENGRIKK